MKWPEWTTVVVLFGSVSVVAGILRHPRTGDGLVFEDCGTQYDVISINLSSCTTAPCKMRLGSNVTVSAEFSANGASTDGILKHDVNFILNGVKTRATITPTTCEGSVCPRQGAQGLLFSANIYVSANLPPINGKLRWELRNNRGDSLLCYQLPVSLA